jgi:crotonobetainyl-CoA:carnitine CoA-transferase CaiB-like acyl-CoA transferase
MTDTSTPGPLSHVRVLDLSRAQPGAYCTGVLADLGADVLRVEPRNTGDTTRMIPGAMEAYHRGKRAMTLDLKHDDAPDVLRRLIAQVDVVVESGLPASLAAQGVSHAGLAADQPGLVWCTISGFGEGSPYARRPAHDVTFLGYSGLMALMAGETVPPTPDFVLAVPFGSLIAVIGILAALTERDRTGTGAFVDRSSTRRSSTARRGCSGKRWLGLRPAALPDGVRRRHGARTAPATASS